MIIIVSLLCLLSVCFCDMIVNVVIVFGCKVIDFSITLVVQLRINCMLTCTFIQCVFSTYY